jgi:DNA transposition AAA+ family ATPase
MADIDQLVDPVTDGASPLDPGALQTPRAGWNFSTDAIRKNLSHCNPEARETMVACFLWCIDDRHPVTRQEFSAAIGYEWNTIWRIYNGTYVDPKTGVRYDVPPKLVAAAKQFLNGQRQRFIEADADFVPTPTAKKVFQTCDLARESHSMVILYGPSHIGKTFALEYYTATNNHGRTIMVKLEAASGLGGMVRRIADACGISDKSNTADLIERIKRGITRETLLIIDECHLLQHTYRKNSFFACIEVIRRLHDFTRAGFVLCWTHLDNLKASSQAELQQVWRRGVHKRPLPKMPTPGDLDAILKASGLAFPDAGLEVTVKKVTEKPREVLRLVAKRDGLLAITERVRYGKKLALKRGEKFAWYHLIEAHLIIEKEAQQEPEWS